MGSDHQASLLCCGVIEAVWLGGGPRAQLRQRINQRELDSKSSQSQARSSDALLVTKSLQTLNWAVGAGMANGLCTLDNLIIDIQYLVSILTPRCNVGQRAERTPHLRDLTKPSGTGMMTPTRLVPEHVDVPRRPDAYLYSDHAIISHRWSCIPARMGFPGEHWD